MLLAALVFTGLRPSSGVPAAILGGAPRLACGNSPSASASRTGKACSSVAKAPSNRPCPSPSGRGAGLRPHCEISPFRLRLRLGEISCGSPSKGVAPAPHQAAAWTGLRPNLPVPRPRSPATRGGCGPSGRLLLRHAVRRCISTTVPFRPMSVISGQYGSAHPSLCVPVSFACWQGQVRHGSAEQRGTPGC
jgi:hypothetical protein